MRCRRLAAALLAALPACRPVWRSAPTTAGPDAAAVREYTVREAPLHQHGLVVRLDIPRAPSGRKGALITFQPEQPSVLAAGFVVATYRVTDWTALTGVPPSPVSAWSATVGKWVLASPSADVLGRSYMELIAANAEHAVPRVLDYLERVPEVDPARIGIAGASTNGFIALQGAAADKRLAAAVVLQACGDYHRFLRYSSLGMEGAPLALDPAYDAWLTEHEPMAHPQRLLHAAVLLGVRETDPIIPIQCAETTARVLGEAYARAGVPERFRFVRWPGGGHGLGDPEAHEMLAWLERWLRPP